MHTSVLLFPAVKKLYMVPLFLLLTGCRYNSSGYIYHHLHNDHILIAVHDIPVGTVLQRSDLTLDHGWALFPRGDVCLLPSAVLSHKTLRPVVKGETVHASDIEGASNQTPSRCSENVADGWSAWP